MAAEATAKELPRLRLADALELTLLIARKSPRRHPRVAARWLLRYLKEEDEASLARIRAGIRGSPPAGCCATSRRKTKRR
jgi:hypothetical protein